MTDFVVLTESDFLKKSEIDKIWLIYGFLFNLTPFRNLDFVEFLINCLFPYLKVSSLQKLKLKLKNHKKLHEDAFKLSVI